MPPSKLSLSSELPSRQLSLSYCQPSPGRILHIILTSITFEEASPTMSQGVKDKARLRFGKTVTNGLINWFRFRPADLKGTKVKNFRKRHVARL